MQYNDAAIIQGGMSLVPNLRDQLVQDSVLKMRQQGFDAVQQQRQAQAEAAARQQEQAQAFQRDFEQAMLTNDPRQILALRWRYPDMAKGMKEVFDSFDEDERRRNLTQIGTIYARAQAGDFTGAAGVLRQRIEADRAAGMADPQDEAILEELESGVPSRQKAALASVGIILAAVEPDKFGETYAKLNPAEKVDPTQREYEWRTATFGKAAADAWLRTQDTKLVPVQPGGTVFEFGGETTGGGDPASGGGGAPQTGGAPQSPNATSGIGATLSMDDFTANVDIFGSPQAAAGMTVRNNTPVRVRSVQEAQKLPSGTLILTPDGQQRVTR